MLYSALVPKGATRRRPITVAALLRAAAELFAEQGFGATSVPDICARAGLTKGAFYSNFANKDALVLALLDRSWEQRAAFLHRAVGGGVPTAGAASTDSAPAGARAEPEIDRQWTLLSAELSLLAIRRPEVAAVLVQHERRMRAELALLVAETLEFAERVPTRPVGELARMIVAVTEGSEIQTLTDEAAGATPTATGPRAVQALLAHFSAPSQTVLPDRRAAL
jgi:AcrR family transcriptional regulator